MQLQKGCTRLAAANDKVYQLLAHGQWFSLGTPVSSTTKAGRHDIAEILLSSVYAIQKSFVYTILKEFCLCDTNEFCLCDTKRVLSCS
jgi:hypothetical protein